MHSKLKIIALAASPFCLLSTAHADPPSPSTASLTEPADFRIVAGTTPAALSYTVTDTGAADQDLDFSILQYTLGANPAKEYGSLVSLTQGEDTTDLSGVSHTGYTLNSGGSANLSVLPDIAGLVAGDVVNVGVQMNGAGWDNPVTSNTGINVVENRLLTGTTTINAGRHMLGQIPDGTLTLSGGSLTGTEGTNISINSGGFAQYANGIRLTSNSDFTFNDAGQSHNLQVGYYGNAGNYTHNITLSGSNGANNYTDASGASRNSFGGYWRTETEYGAVIGGGTETRVTGQSLTPSQALGGSIPNNNIPEGSNYTIERASNLVGTLQSSPAPSLNNGLLATSRAGGNLVNERRDALITGESIQGGNLDLSGVSVSVTGTALRNRVIGSYVGSGSNYGKVISLGRQIAPGGTETVNRTDTMTLTSSGSDLTNTRTHLSDFNVNDGSELSASYANGGAGQDFTGAGGQQASVEVTANFEADRSTLGFHSKTVNSGSGSIQTLENGGIGLTNENVQGGVTLGYTWSNVAENEITGAQDQNVFVYQNDNISGRTLSSRGVSRYSITTHTDIGIDSSFSVAGSNGTVGAASNQTVTMNSANGRITGEGLANEQVTASGSFGVIKQVVGHAEASAERAGEVLSGGETVNITNTDRNLGSARQADLRVMPVGYTGDDRWTVNYTGAAILAAGQSASLTTVFDDTGLPTAGEGELGKSYRSIVTFNLSDHYDIDSKKSLLGISNSQIAYGNETYSGGVRSMLGGNSEQVSWIMERTVAQTAETGSSTISGGTDLGANGLNLTNTGDNSSAGFAATTASILDSGVLGAETTVSMTFTKTEDASTHRVLGSQGESTEFATDVLDLSGLNGEQHVIQLTYDEAALTTDEKFVQLVWLTSFDSDPETEGVQAQDIWVNAVLGNSDVIALDVLGETVTTAEGTVAVQTYLNSKRFEGSYAEYLDSIDSIDPVLGAWGVDVDNNTVWSVVDHNSSFAGAVPEPSSIALLGLGGIACLLRRRR